MLLLFSDTQGADMGRAKLPAGSGRCGSAWGRSLLAAAWHRYVGGEMPAVAADAWGKPYFPDAPQVHFSLSHTDGLVLCAIGAFPLGADAERPRPLRPGTAERLMTPDEAADFSFFQLWTLRESYFKLTGRGGMRSPRFWRAGETVCCADASVHIRLYDIGGCPAAVCAGVDFRAVPEALPVSDLLRAAE